MGHTLTSRFDQTAQFYKGGRVLKYGTPDILVPWVGVFWAKVPRVLKYTFGWVSFYIM